MNTLRENFLIMIKKVRSEKKLGLLKKNIRKPFVTSVLMVASGTALSQFISMLFTPVLTRVYGPSSMGIFGIFTSIMTVLVPISALTYPIAIILPKKDKEAKELMLLSFYVSLILSFTVTIIALLFSNRLFTGTLEKLKPFMLFLPIVMVLASIVEIVRQWLIRKQEFKIMTRVSIIQSLVNNLMKLMLGILAPTAATLILVTTLGTGVNVVLLLIGIGVSFLTIKKSKLFINEETLKVANKYGEFPKYRAPQTFINSISISLPIFMLTTLFGPVSVGFFTISDRVLQLPVNLISNSIGNVLYPRISQAYINKENIASILIKATLVLIGIGILPFGIIIMFGPILFSVLFGQDWLTAGVYARWLGVWVYSSFVNKPAAISLPVLGAQKFHLIHTIVSIVCKSVALAIGGLIFNNDVVAIALYGLIGALLNVVLILVTIYKSKILLKE